MSEALASRAQSVEHDDDRQTRGSKMIGFRVPADRIEALEVRAKQAGLSTHGFARQLVLDQLAGEETPLLQVRLEVQREREKWVAEGAADARSSYAVELSRVVKDAEERGRKAGHVRALSRVQVPCVVCQGPAIVDLSEGTRLRKLIAGILAEEAVHPGGCEDSLTDIAYSRGISAREAARRVCEHRRLFGSKSGLPKSLRF
jgi:hypothetical protein